MRFSLIFVERGRDVEALRLTLANQLWEVS